MADSKWRKRKEVNVEKKTKSCRPKKERSQKWKKLSQNLLKNPPEITDKPIPKIINRQVEIKLGQFTEEELDRVLKYHLKYGR